VARPITNLDLHEYIHLSPTVFTVGGRHKRELLRASKNGLGNEIRRAPGIRKSLYCLEENGPLNIRNTQWNWEFQPSMSDLELGMSHLAARSSWKEMYTAALFENDPCRIFERIAVAESEIVKRARDLFEAQEDNSDEAEALDDALYMLRALKSCLKLKTAEGFAA